MTRPSGAEFKTLWTFMSVPLRAVMAWTAIAQPLSVRYTMVVLKVMSNSFL